MTTHPEPYRMLTVRQPWADLLVPGPALIELLTEQNPALLGRLPKDVENRSRRTPWRASVLIHAGKKPDREAMNRYWLDSTRFVYGAVIGIVRLVDVIDNSPSYWAQAGRSHWQVADAERLPTPYACDGFLGLRVASPATVAAVLSLRTPATTAGERT